jgi:hypothetical protein
MRGFDPSRESIRPSSIPVNGGSGRPSSFNPPFKGTPQHQITGRPSRMDNGPPNRKSIAQNNNSSGRSSEFPRQTSSFDEYQSQEHYNKQGKQRPTFINNQRPTHRGTAQHHNEFARATINSMSSIGGGDNSSDEEHENEDEDFQENGRQLPENFRGTGQNG